jgi:hypothetical protein
MTRGTCGYGRYDDDPDHIGCPRAVSDMTPCIARDGRSALTDDLCCAGCRCSPHELLAELDRAAGGITIISNGRQMTGRARTYYATDALTRRVRQLTEPQRRP